MTQMTSDEEIERCRRVPLHLLTGQAKIDKKIKIRCPFHMEKTPSCVLFPTGGFKCYGCGANGNSIDFILKLGGTFEDAIRDLKREDSWTTSRAKSL